VRLKYLDVSGFRGFPSDAKFDLDADAVIIEGVNGSGKTSFFDAILWALLGRVERLGGSENVISRYSASGGARVELTLGDVTGDDIVITRRIDEEMYLTVRRGDSVESGPKADATILELLWPEARSASDPAVALSRSLTRATYLQQDSVRQFVDADDDKERFEVVGELIGIGRVTELQRQLEGGRRAWSRATNLLDQELEPQRQERSRLEHSLAQLGDMKPSADPREIEAWFEAVNRTLPSNPQIGQNERTAKSVSLLTESLRSQDLAASQRLTRLSQIESHLATRPSTGGSNSEEMSGLLAAATARRDQLMAQLAVAQVDAADSRRRLTQKVDAVESARTFAQLALRHLDELCPVCNQDYDRPQTEARLREAADQSALEEQSPVVSEVSSLADEVERATQELTRLDARASQNELDTLRLAAWQNNLESLGASAGIAVPVDPEAVSQALNEQRSIQEEARRLLDEGERLTVQLTRSTEALRKREMLDQLRVLETGLATAEQEIGRRKYTGESATRIIELLRDANDRLVATELDRIDPSLQRIFSAIDPHPTFRAASFATETRGGIGRLWTTVRDEPGDVTVREPQTVLSSSQLNVLAVAIFLSLNLSIASLPLQVIALDDPLQSLDDVNLLGLTDLLRRVRGTRQVLVSTHDDKLAHLLARKLRPVADGSRTVRIDLTGWSSSGPSISQSDVPVDSGGLRLIS